MATNYIKRLKIPIIPGKGYAPEFRTRDGLLIAVGYTRIVIGERGPYIEFAETNIRKDHYRMPIAAEWRKDLGKAYYIEYRTICNSNVKIYWQKRKVIYADYKLGYYYISPFDLLADGRTIIEPLKREKKRPQVGKIL